MWLKKLVGLCMLITLLGMNAIVLAGFFGPDKSRADFGLSQITAMPPTVTLTAEPTETTVGMFSALRWETTGNITSCTASGDWGGQKTPFGGESTGKLSSEGAKTYSLTCENKAGKSQPAIATVNVRPAPAIATPSPSKPAPAQTANPTTPTTTTTPTQTAPKPAIVYCGGATPCYSPREIAAHGRSGDCWGWNGDRVINITGFDTAYHLSKTGRGSIEVSGVCGKDLAPSLSGSVAVGGSGQDHKATTKANADRNMIPYLVGYFDSSKP